MSHPIGQLLKESGYRLQERADFWNCAANYRGGKNPNALAINKTSGWFRDFKTGQSGPPEKLAELIKGVSVSFDGYVPPPEREFIESPKVFDPAILKTLVPHYDLFIKRGISTETMRQFQAGYCHGGKMAHRVCFPIYDARKRIVGLAGRWYSEQVPDKQPKWKIWGPKKEFLYPLHLNESVIRERREIILTEGIGEVLRLNESGILTGIVMFGASLSAKMLSFIVGADPKRIIVATNRDDNSNGEVGQKAAGKICGQLNKLFNPSKIIVAHPPGNDIGEMNNEQTIEWYERIPLTKPTERA